MTRVFNKNSEKQKRRDLRLEMPRAEVILWSRIRARHLSDFKFRRQYSVGPYVVDFYCAEAKLAIEIDGESHFVDEETKARDRKRQRYIESFGIRVVRFTNEEVYERTWDVLNELDRACQNRMEQKRKRATNNGEPN